MYTDEDYEDAVDFVLNYPPELLGIVYDEVKDIYTVHLMDEGIYKIKLEGQLIRSAVLWEGERQWPKMSAVIIPKR
jgi:hypothetical protein